MYADFSSKIILSVEVHSLYRLNRQNCRFWGTENRHVIVGKQMHPLCVYVWCRCWVGGLIGTYLSKNAAGQAVTMLNIPTR